MSTKQQPKHLNSLDWNCPEKFDSSELKKETCISLFTKWMVWYGLYVTQWFCLQIDVTNLKQSERLLKKGQFTQQRKVIFNRSQSVYKEPTAALVPVLRISGHTVGFNTALLLSVWGTTDWTAEHTNHCGKIWVCWFGWLPTHFFLLTLGFLTGLRYGLSITLSSVTFWEGTTPLGGSMEFSLSFPGSSWMRGKEKDGSKQLLLYTVSHKRFTFKGIFWRFRKCYFFLLKRLVLYLNPNTSVLTENIWTTVFLRNSHKILLRFSGDF